jgi:hypothetical protein
MAGKIMKQKPLNCDVDKVIAGKCEGSEATDATELSNRIEPMEASETR